MCTHDMDTLKFEDKLKLNVKVHLERLRVPHLKCITTTSSSYKTSSEIVNNKKANVQTIEPGFLLRNPTTQSKAGRNNKNRKNLRVEFTDHKPSRSAPRRDLRKGKIKNYAELSVCSCEEKCGSSKSEKHVPIYLKQDTVTKPNKRLKDPFEFVLETPRAYKKNRQKQKCPQGNHIGLKNINSESDGDSLLYDKETHLILKKLEAREEAKLKAKRHAEKLFKKNRDKKINRKDVILADTNKTDINTRVPKEPLITIESKTCKTTQSNNLKTTENVLKTIDDDIECCFGFDDDSEDGESIVPVSPDAYCTTTKNPTLLKKAKKMNALPNFVALTSTPLSEHRQLSRKINSHTSNKINIISNIKIPSKVQTKQNKHLQNIVNKSNKLQYDNLSIQESLQKLPFSKQITSLVVSTPQNQTLQNVTTRGKILTSMPANQKSAIPFSTIRQVSSIAMSTPQNQDQAASIDFREPLDTPNSPWRSYSDNISRNPHFLALKNSFLPSYNQDMILDATLLEKRSNSQLSIKSNENSLLQSHLLDFTEESSSKCNTPSKAIIEQSLFDNAQFSPIKSNKEDITSSPKTKRNVFEVLKPSNKENLPKSGQVLDVGNYFGFDSMYDDENEENIENRGIVTRTSNRIKAKAQPTRVLLEEVKNLQKEVVTDMLENMEFKEVQEHEFPTEQNDDELQMALFEDLEVHKGPRRSYQCKRARRVRFRSVDSDELDEVVKPKVKRKDLRTPQEVKEFNKWIAQFNAMCEEVENHTLETDGSSNF